MAISCTGPTSRTPARTGFGWRCWSETIGSFLSTRSNASTRLGQRSAFAAATERAVGTVAALRLPWADIAAAQLKFRARLARAGAARAELGDLLRASAGLAREQRALSDLGQTAGISRAFLYRIIDG